MDSVSQKINQQYRECAGKGCSNSGIYQMTVLYLGRSGWFCVPCKNKLIAEGLIVEDSKQVLGLEVSRSITHSHQTSKTVYSSVELKDLKQ